MPNPIKKTKEEIMKSVSKCQKECLDTYHGGYHTAKELEIFQHGMTTVFNVMRGYFMDSSLNKLLDAAINGGIADKKITRNDQLLGEFNITEADLKESYNNANRDWRQLLKEGK